MPHTPAMLFTALALLVYGCATSPHPPNTTPFLETTVRFAVIGDYGTGDDSGDNERGPAELVAGWASDPGGLDFVITVGDNNYSKSLSIDSYLDVVCGHHYYRDFVKTSADPNQDHCKAGKNIFFPTPGNHDWDSDHHYSIYKKFFPEAGTDDPEHPHLKLYYDFAYPPLPDPALVHLFSFNANCSKADKHGTNENSKNKGCPVTGSDDCADQYSVQIGQVKKRMKKATATWNLVYFHQPPYSASSHPGCPAIAALDFAGPDFVDAAKHGMMAVLSGHAHEYQRIVEKATPNVPFFIVGSSGRLSSGACKHCKPGSHMRCAYCYDKHHGAMLVTASTSQITFEFYRANGDRKDSCTITRDDQGAQQLSCTGHSSSDYCGTPPSGVPACGVDS